MQWAILCLLLLSSLPAIYLLSLTLAAITSRVWPASRGTVLPDNGPLALIIPAKDEEGEIEHTLLELSRILDPKVSVHVIADNCVDETERVARDAIQRFGIRGSVLRRDEPSKMSKGHALAWAIPRVLDSGQYQFIGILDADSKLMPGAIVEVRREFARGARVIQSSYQLAESSGWRGKIIRLGVAAHNVTRGWGKAALGMGDTLKGNGMWFRREVLEENPWSAFSATEDIEYSIQLAVAGIPVTFVGESEIFGKGAESAVGQAIQRVRWEGGRLFIARAILARKTEAMKPSTLLVGLIADIVMPPLAFLVLFYVGGLYFAPVTSMIALMGLAAHVVMTLWIARLPFSYVGTFFLVPLYLVWKLLLLPSTIQQSASTEWKRTPRENETQKLKSRT